jgi:hypothetical protein
VLNPDATKSRLRWPASHRLGLPAAQASRNTSAGFYIPVPLKPTGHLLTLLDKEYMSGQAATLRIAEELRHPAPDQLLAFAATLLDDLRLQGIALGTQP